MCLCREAKQCNAVALLLCFILNMNKQALQCIYDQCGFGWLHLRQDKKHQM